MFDKQTYIQRRKRLADLVENGVILLIGNNEVPANYPANFYYPFRQDSTFLYYFGLKRDNLIALIDIEEGTTTLYGDDIDIEDIVWYGSVESISMLAKSTGVTHTSPKKDLIEVLNKARNNKREIHFLPPYRHDTMITLMDFLGIHPVKQKECASIKLIKAVVEMRSAKEKQEIDAIERACDIGYIMHTTAMKLIKPGITERQIGGQIDGIAGSLAQKVSFPTIFTQHGEIMHGGPSDNKLEAERLALCDAGCELDDYCSDNTRTMPVNGAFTQKQLEIYSIVEECHDYVLSIAKPNIRWYDVHMNVCLIMAKRLKELGLMKGDTQEAVSKGAHAMFMPHGLGHMMGLDVHDMEALDQKYVGFDEETKPSEQFGTNCLRMGRRLRENFVMTDEPGIYFIPALIDNWQEMGHCKEWLNFDLIQKYRDFGGIRIEDDILITSDGCRMLGKKRIPYHPKDVEEFMKK